MRDRVDVLVVGAGLSGIGAGYRPQTECPGKSYPILEGRQAIGGTWDLFRYPGVRSDSDMFTLGYPFRPWRSRRAIASAETIRDYIIVTATGLTMVTLGEIAVEVEGAPVSTREPAPPAGLPTTGEPLMKLTSGYVRRADAVLPRQGTRRPWRMRNNYLTDYPAMRLGRIDDGNVRFTRVPAGA